MGVDFRATALIGVELDKSKMMKTYRERGCEHEISSAKYCGICGEHTWIEYEDYLEVFSEEPETSDGDALKSNEVFSGYNLASTTDDHRVFLGVEVSAWDGIVTNEAKMEPIEHYTDNLVLQIRNDLKTFLEPYDLWDESKFGLWAIAHVSY